ncbi:MAG: DUF3040 domain-containing protein [Mycolicibacterium mageritense]|uniref:DUF3040 domain-containing protein n=2 Tax=Mycobacteriaceae TaxID=1762 RepID=A0AAI8TWW8_MYCME|nr:MAG: DUF3040 domain-containing protein [Mycolicibacterium mageritense]BDY30349.1 hypothetical protein hbim_04292 [Mycolicibacterium mageritense]
MPVSGNPKDDGFDARRVTGMMAAEGEKMPLSDYEKHLLADIERELQSDDPKLAQHLRAPYRVAVRRMKAAALIVSGLAAMVAAMIVVPTMIAALLTASVLGYLLMLAGAVYLVTGPGKPSLLPEGISARRVWTRRRGEPTANG